MIRAVAAAGGAPDAWAASGQTTTTGEGNGNPWSERSVTSLSVGGWVSANSTVLVDVQCRVQGLPYFALAEGTKEDQVCMRAAPDCLPEEVTLPRETRPAKVRPQVRSRPARTRHCAGPCCPCLFLHRVQDDEKRGASALSFLWPCALHPEAEILYALDPVKP